ncbi:hypothetical protein DFR70_101752 [Nocardia tenerifensis]|uniref:Uncharacterized protein n=1 Tax=Nocardia tenerifensis TaxID=228006 RepID=A0A318KNR9_9NOCA|nr:hypothetical protein [Nocardia tenerifensis]PXX71330.1 hypothetical protein DFR70_101752 [Nocardia tenerifensis]
MIDNRALAVRLSVPRERWGWVFTVPAPPTPSPARACAPRWAEQPPPPKLTRLREQSRRAPVFLGVGSAISVWATGMAAAFGFALWPIVLPAGVLVSAGWCARTRRRYSAARREYQSWRTGEIARFEAAQAEWAARVAEHDRREQRRIATTTLWHPLRLGPDSARVDVFGGTADGWAGLLGTLGASLLADGARLLVLDFTEQRVAAELAELGRLCGHPAAVTVLPEGELDLLAGLTPAEVGEVVAEAVATLREPGAQSAQTRGLDAELVELVAANLVSPVTFGRIAAGIRLLRSISESEHETTLSGEEIRRVNRLLDVVGSSESARTELRFLGGLLSLLDEGTGRRAADSTTWPKAGLRVIATEDANPRRKDLLDRVVFHRVLHGLRCGRPSGRGGVLVVAGADHLGLAGVEALARHARRAGVRLVLLIEHLRGDLVQLLGGSDSASILMRMGNAAEAAAAADFVGRGHRFVLSQLSDQIGRSFTEGVSDTTGDSLTATTTEGYSGAAVNVSDSVSRAATWSSTTSWSGSDSTSSGRTYARAYEYSIEPTTFQALPVTAFILVETVAGARRVVAGDCNPGIALLDRVAPEPVSHPGGPP